MRIVSLFAGIGGLELGLEQAGMTTVAQVERDPYCNRILAKHWPTVARHDDVITFPQWWKAQDLEANLVCAGFPCQPFSFAGKQLGVNDERWLWPATEAAIRAVRPRYVLLENVAALTRDRLAFGSVLSGLHTLGFNAEWATLRASDFGAPHNRQRVYIVAYAPSLRSGTYDHVVPSGEGRTPLTVGGLSGLSVHGRRRKAREWLECEPRVDRLVDGIPNQVDRLRVAGNAVVPAVARHIGGMIIDHAQTLEVAA